MKPDPYTNYAKAGPSRTRMADADFRALVDDLRQRHLISAVIGRHVVLKRAGRELVGLCAFHQERTPSMRVNDAKGSYHCFGCGAHGDAIRFLMDGPDGLSFMDALRHLSDSDLPVVSEADRIRAAAEDAATRASAIADARTMAGRCVDPVGTPAEVYARSRGITIALPPSIRFGMVPAWRDKDSGEWTADRPALVGLCVNGADELVAIQRIFLRDGGRAKANMRKPKLTLGRIRGAALRLGPVAEHVTICEGPEDGLTLMQEVPGSSIWVALGTALMADVELPPAVRVVTLAGDNNAAGKVAVERAGEALALRGLEVRTMYPDPAYADFNDMLRGLRL